MENLLFLGVPVLKLITVYVFKNTEFKVYGYTSKGNNVFVNYLSPL